MSVATRHVTIAMNLAPIFRACVSFRRFDKPGPAGPGQVAPRESLFDRIAEARSNARARAAQPSGPGQADPDAGRRRSTHRWKPEQRFVVSTGEDQAARDVTRNHVTYRRIPASNQLAYEQLRERGDALSSLTIRSRLDVIAHGTSTHVTVPGRASYFAIGPERLAQDLHRGGLRQVGVLKLRCCDTGVPGKQLSFLERLRDEFERLGVRVGFITGPNGIFFDNRATITIAGRDVVTYGPSKGFLPTLKSRLHPTGVLEPDWQRLSQQEGMRVIRGTDPRVSFHGTRYV